MAETATRDEYVNFKWLGGSIEDIPLSMCSFQFILKEMVYYTKLESVYGCETIGILDTVRFAT